MNSKKRNASSDTKLGLYFGFLDITGTNAALVLGR